MDLAEIPWACPSCETPMHPSCAEYVGGCIRFACPQAASPRRRVITVLEDSGQIAAWGWWGMGVFSLIQILELALGGLLHGPLGLLAVGLLGYSMVSARRMDRLRSRWQSRDASMDELLQALKFWRQPSALLRHSHAPALLIGGAYVAIRLAFWRGPLPFLTGLIFLGGCLVFSIILSKADAQEAELARIASAWTGEFDELLAEGSSPGGKKTLKMVLRPGVAGDQNPH